MPEIAVSFVVDQPVERVWTFLQDIPAVVSCAPGLELTGQSAPDTYQGRIGVRLGPIAATFEGEAVIKTADADRRMAVIEGRGVDRRGGNRATATMRYAIEPADAGSTVRITSAFALTGALAQMGRTGIFQDVAAELTRQFAAALTAKLAAIPGSTEVSLTAAATAAPAPPAQPMGLWPLVRAVAEGIAVRLCARLAALFGRRSPARD